MNKMLSVVVAAAGTTALSAQPLAWRSFDAALDPAGDTAWANTGTLQTGGAQNFNFATASTAVNVNDAFAVGLTKAYDISVTGAAAGTAWTFWGQAGGNPPRANHAEVSYEVFFNAVDLNGSHVIMEIGGAGAGVSIVLDGDNLIWATNQGGPDTPDTTTISSTIGTGWHHAVATWNRNSLMTSLYVDGQFIGSAALDADTTGWVGGNEAGLGGLTSASIATNLDQNNLTDFDGQIAAFNYYNVELSAQQAADNFNAVFIPAPGSAAMLAVGGLIAARRRR